MSGGSETVSRPGPRDLFVVMWKGREYTRIRLPRLGPTVMRMYPWETYRLSCSVTRRLLMHAMPTKSRIEDWRVRSHPRLRFHYTSWPEPLRVEVYLLPLPDSRMRESS